MHRWTGGNYEIAEQGCYHCGATADLISTDVVIEQEGILALCTGCVVTMAQHGGYKLWSPEQEAELENYRVRCRDAEAYQRIAEDAVISIFQLGTEINDKRVAERAALEERLGERDSKGRFLPKTADA